MQKLFEQLTSDWIAAVKAKDAARFASMATEDCVFLAPNAPPLRGRKKVLHLRRSARRDWRAEVTWPAKSSQGEHIWLFLISL